MLLFHITASVQVGHVLKLVPSSAPVPLHLLTDLILSYSSILSFKYYVFQIYSGQSMDVLIPWPLLDRRIWNSCLTCSSNIQNILKIAEHIVKFSSSASRSSSRTTAIGGRILHIRNGQTSHAFLCRTRPHRPPESLQISFGILLGICTARKHQDTFLDESSVSLPYIFIRRISWAPESHNSLFLIEPSHHHRMLLFRLGRVVLAATTLAGLRTLPLR